MGNKILSICVATYNRADLIGETLGSILPQTTDKVEVLVVDGASTDDTEYVVKRYQTKYPELRYVRLPVKGGVDQDFDRSIELANGEYCWLFSDDDILKPGAIETVLEAIKNQYSLVVVNSEIRNLDLSQRLADRKLKRTSNCIYEDNAAEKERFFSEIADYLTFIGGVVIRRKIWLSRNRSKYYGSRFIHVGVIFQSPMPGKVLVIAKPLIEIRLGNAEWSSLGFEIWMFKWPGLIWSFDNYSDVSKQSVCRKNPWQRLHTLIYYRAIGVYSLNEYSKWLKNLLNTGWRRFVAQMIAQIPRSFANRLLLLYAKLQDDRLLIYGLSNSLPASQRRSK
jgi:abequosyltransferase